MDSSFGSTKVSNKYFNNIYIHMFADVCKNLKAWRKHVDSVKSWERPQDTWTCNANSTKLIR